MASEQSIWLKLKSAFSGECFKKAQAECGNVGKAVKALGPIFSSVAGKFGDLAKSIATGGQKDSAAAAEATLKDNATRSLALETRLAAEKLKVENETNAKIAEQEREAAEDREAARRRSEKNYVKFMLACNKEARRLE